MSYVVHLWEHPAPRTLRGAASLHSSLSSQPTRPNSKWQRLRMLVEARMASLDTPMPEWPEGAPPDPGYLERSLGMLVDGPDHYLDVLVEAANSLGFSVYDEQAATLFLPFGYLLTFEGLKRLVPPAAKIGEADLERVLHTCEQAWRPRFEAAGYIFGRGLDISGRHPQLTASRSVPVGQHEVHISFTTMEGRLSCDVAAYIRLNLPETVLQAAGGAFQIEVRGGEYRGMAALMLEPRWAGPPLSIGGTLRSEAHLTYLLDAVFEYFDEEIGPTLDACREVEQVLAAVMGERDLPGQLRESRATFALAWLDGDATLQRVFARMEALDPQWVEDRGKAVRDALNGLVRPD